MSGSAVELGHEPVRHGWLSRYLLTDPALTDTALTDTALTVHQWLGYVRAKRGTLR